MERLALRIEIGAAHEAVLLVRSFPCLQLFGRGEFIDQAKARVRRRRGPHDGDAEIAGKRMHARMRSSIAASSRACIPDRGARSTIFVTAACSTASLIAAVGRG